MRDYSRFLKDDGRLDPRLLPRQVYTQIVREYRREPEVITEVFQDHFFLWDLEEQERKLAADGENVDRGEIAQQILAGMDEDDWWKVTRSFEAHLQQHFQSCAPRWSELLDPVYDEQEAAGWIARQ